MNTHQLAVATHAPAHTEEETTPVTTTAAHAEDSHEAAGPLGALGVEWNLFAAQLLNFAIVFYVMHRFVYKPLLKLLDERTAKIEQGLADADAAAGAKKDAQAAAEHAIA